MPGLDLLRCLPLGALLAGPQPCAGEQPLERLAYELSTELRGKVPGAVAVLDFPYAGGAPSEGSSIVRERLTTALAALGRSRVVERSRLDAILRELRLEQSGLVDPKAARGLGTMLGVDAVLTGTLHDLPGGKTEVHARFVDLDSGAVLSAARAELTRTWPDSAILPSPPVERAPPPARQSPSTAWRPGKGRWEIDDPAEAFFLGPDAERRKPCQDANACSFSRWPRP